MSELIQWPDTGELNRRVEIKQWQDVPDFGTGLDYTEDDGLKTWAKVETMAGSKYWGYAQVSEDATHAFWVRYRTGTRPSDLTGSHVIELNKFRYRILSCTDVGGAGRFTLIQAKELGPVTLEALL